MGSCVKSWTFHFRWQHKPVRMTIGRYPDIGLAAARSAVRTYRAMLASDPPEDPRTAKIAPGEAAAASDDPETVSDLITAYIAAKRAVVEAKRIRTIDAVELVLTRDVGKLIGSERLATLGLRQLNKPIDAKVAKGRHNAAQRVHDLTRAMFNWAVSRQYVPSNPMRGMARPEIGEPVRYALNEKEIKAFWHKLEKALPKTHPEYANVLRFCLVTGCRLGEAADLNFAREWIDANGNKFREIDRKAKIWRLPRERAKNRTEHHLPLTDIALSLLSDDPVYPWGKPVSKTMLSNAFSNGGATRRLGINDLATIHAIRRTVATQMVKIGIAESTVSRVLNHLPPSRSPITSIYIRHDFIPEKRAALEAWEKRLGQLLVDSGGNM